jgi:hypothetical protein
MPAVPRILNCAASRGDAPALCSAFVLKCRALENTGRQSGDGVNKQAGLEMPGHSESMISFTFLS